MTPELQDALEDAMQDFERAVAAILRDHPTTLAETTLILNTTAEATGMVHRATAKLTRQSTTSSAKDAPHW